MTHGSALRPAHLLPTHQHRGEDLPSSYPILCRHPQTEGYFPELATKNSWRREGGVGEGVEANSFQMCQGMGAKGASRPMVSRRGWEARMSWPPRPALQSCQGSWAAPLLKNGAHTHVCSVREPSVLHLQGSVGKPCGPAAFRGLLVSYFLF